MEKVNRELLPDEQILEQITATFEVTGAFGIGYKFAQMLATDKRVILYTAYPFTRLKEMITYRYDEIIEINVAYFKFSVENIGSMQVKFVVKGNATCLLETLQLRAYNAPGIRNFHQNAGY